jgi:hypothetical protein
VSKSSGGGLFGARRAGEVTLVETPVSRAFARKARVTFFAVGIATTAVTVVGLHHRDPALAVLVGVVVGAVAGFVAGAGVVVWPVVRVLWHWSAEITAAVLLLVAWSWLSDLVPGGWALLLLAVLVGAPAAVPPVRRQLVAVGWCAIVRHRLRTCFAEFLRTPGRLSPGRLPLILAAWPTPAGERVWVWLRAGLELADLEGRCGKLAVACWADQVVAVRASRSYAALVRVDVTRRDPLTAPVASPLIDRIPGAWLHRDQTARPTPPAGLDLPDVPEPTTPAPASVTRPARARRSPASVAVDDNPFI